MTCIEVTGQFQSCHINAITLLFPTFLLVPAGEIFLNAHKNLMKGSKYCTHGENRAIICEQLIKYNNELKYLKKG